MQKGTSQPHRRATYIFTEGKTDLYYVTKTIK